MTKQEVLAKLSSGELSVEQASVLLDAVNEKPIGFKVSEKGAVSVYGLQKKFPVTLYLEQWERLIDHLDELKAFIKANDKMLSRKGDKKPAAAVA